MNRLVIIGNGFDLAHGLATSYKEFISWYFSSLNNQLLNCTEREAGDALCSFKLSQSCEFTSIRKYLANNCIYEDAVNQIRRYHTVKVEDSGLIKEISLSLQTKKWVDIELDYYHLLTQQCANSVDYLTKVDKLNNDLECLKRHLFEYLNMICRHTEFKCISDITEILFAPIRKEDIAVDSFGMWTRHVEERMTLTYDEICNRLLGYNLPGCEYAKLDDFIKSGRSLAGSKFDINDMVKIPKAYYKKLENKNDNEYLRNMKSIRYQETDNYRRMLSFIEAAPYQIFILGHSCGISDRTLLNTLFEHKNCASIKPFYYHNGICDNYNDIIASISRNFTDMKKMRDRVVNKTYCIPMPQAKTTKEE